jgi:hypothetical protein
MTRTLVILSSGVLALTVTLSGFYAAAFCLRAVATLRLPTYHVMRVVR